MTENHSMHYQMFIFIVIVLLIYSGINTFIYVHILPVLRQNNQLRIILNSIFIFLVISYPLGRILEIWSHGIIIRILILTGSYWLAAMTFLFFGYLLIDIIRSVVSLFFSSGFFTLNKANIFYLLVSLTIIGLVYGRLNATSIKVKEVPVKVVKKLSLNPELRVALVSDIHLGSMVKTEFLENIVEKINSLKPDIVLFAGDIVNEDVYGEMRENIVRALKNLHASLGAYAVTGNHEYISGKASLIEECLSEAGISTLKDEYVSVGRDIIIIGRKDRDVARFTGTNRKKLEDIISQTDKDKLLIIMDHQPMNLEEADDLQIDLQVSGHTHHGQIFPFNLLTNLVYEKSWGYHKKCYCQYYVSCGVGTWGPPIRIGSSSEIVLLRIKSTNK